jgi:hypothetical protein
VTQQAKCPLTQHAACELRLAVGFRISEKPLARGVFTLEVFCYAGAETATGGRFHSAFQWPVESKHYRRWKVCRTRGERPISGGEYSLSRHEQFDRQRLYSSVTI